jgi:hypothetical protein
VVAVVPYDAVEDPFQVQGERVAVVKEAYVQVFDCVQTFDGVQAFDA